MNETAKTPLAVRTSLVSALQLDLVGPTGTIGDHDETLSQQPSKWYLTGFLVPTDSSEYQKVDETVTEELDQQAVPDPNLGKTSRYAMIPIE